jgi:hypothetical protein
MQLHASAWKHRQAMPETAAAANVNMQRQKAKILVHPRFAGLNFDNPSQENIDVADC